MVGEQELLGGMVNRDCPECIALTLELQAATAHVQKLQALLQQSVESLMTSLQLVSRVITERDQLLEQLSKPSNN